MKAYFQKLFEYNRWAGERVMRCLNAQQVNDPKILSLMGHVLAAQLLWLHRVKKLPPPQVQLWGNYTREELDRMWVTAAAQWLEFVESRDRFDEDLSYTNYKGEPYTNSMEMIMIHLVNHSTYHRAQIAQLLRQQGYEPVNTDFITYDRVLRGQWTD
jgi:uncharacterized damage-inducible protein DinB